MKKIFLSIFIFIGLTPLFAQNCTINGHFDKPEFQGKKVYLLDARNTKAAIDSATIDSNSFTLSFPIKETFIGFVITEQIPSFAYYYSTFIAESGNIYLDLETDSLSGTPLNEKYVALTYNEKVYQAMVHKMKLSINPLKEEVEKVEQKHQEIHNQLVNAYKENKDNALGAMMLALLLNGYENNYDNIEPMLEGAAPIVKEINASALTRLEKMRATCVGKHYTDLELNDFKTGKKVKLSKYIDGKVAIIDFWASWCRPCRAEIPNIANIYNSYKDRGIAVISLNVWDKPEPQKKAIEDLKMDWIQLTDSTPESTNIYGIDGIPHIMLIDKDGTIVARDLRGEEIETALLKVLSK